MKRSLYKTKQIFRKLREADDLLAEGADVAEVCRQLQVSIQTYQCWRHQLKFIRPHDVVSLKAIEKENARLKRLLAGKKLQRDLMREVPWANF